MPDSTIAGLPAVANLAADDQFAIERPAPANANHHVTALQIWDDIPNQVRHFGVTPYMKRIDTGGGSWGEVGQYIPIVGAGTLLSDASDEWVRGQFIVPSDFASGLNYRAVVICEPGVAGTPKVIRTWYQACFWACGENHPYELGTCVTLDNQDENVVIDQVTHFTTNCLQTIAIPGVAAGDLVQVAFERYGAHANDTIGDNVAFVIFDVSYTRHVNQ